MKKIIIIIHPINQPTSPKMSPNTQELTTEFIAMIDGMDGIRQGQCFVQIVQVQSMESNMMAEHLFNLLTDVEGSSKRKSLMGEALLLATKKGNVNAVNWLISHGVDVNYSRSKSIE